MRVDRWIQSMPLGRCLPGQRGTRSLIMSLDLALAPTPTLTVLTIGIEIGDVPVAVQQELIKPRRLLNHARTVPGIVHGFDALATPEQHVVGHLIGGLSLAMCAAEELLGAISS